jgi:RNA polymerase sigma-70 factor (ECF subfamily)
VTDAASATDVFERERPRLVGLAYRMLGTVADAEDVVQDAWLRWEGTDRSAVERPAAWLTTVTARIALDHLRAAERRRESYVGPWLPEPVMTGPGPAEAAELAESLRFGFLTLLDRLEPTERVVLLMADVFAIPFADIGPAVGKSDAACRQIARRARQRVRRPEPPVPLDSDRAVVDALVAAIALGDVDGVLAHLTPDAVCISDGGAERRAARRPVMGAARVTRLLVNLAKRAGGGTTVLPAVLNGNAGLVLTVDGDADLALIFEVTGARVSAIWMTRNPHKLGHVAAPVALR